MQWNEMNAVEWVKWNEWSEERKQDKERVLLSLFNGMEIVKWRKHASLSFHCLSSLHFPFHYKRAKLMEIKENSCVPLFPYNSLYFILIWVFCLLYDLEVVHQEPRTSHGKGMKWIMKEEMEWIHALLLLSFVIHSFFFIFNSFFTPISLW